MDNEQLAGIIGGMRPQNESQSVAIDEVVAILRRQNVMQQAGSSDKREQLVAYQAREQYWEEEVERLSKLLKSAQDRVNICVVRVRELSRDVELEELKQ